MKILTNATTIDALGVEKKSQALVIQEGRIDWCGDRLSMPKEYDPFLNISRSSGSQGAAEIVDCGGDLITPGLIDCHTHLVYAGQRAEEFKQRLEGATYEEIARQGGGILSSGWWDTINGSANTRDLRRGVVATVVTENYSHAC